MSLHVWHRGPIRGTRPAIRLLIMSAQDYHQGFAHADMISEKVRENPARPVMRGQDFEIVKNNPSSAGVEWIIY